MSLPCAAESHLGDGSENFPNAGRGSADSWGVGHRGAGEREREDGMGAFEADMAKAG